MLEVVCVGAQSFIDLHWSEAASNKQGRQIKLIILPCCDPLCHGVDVQTTLNWMYYQIRLRHLYYWMLGNVKALSCFVRHVFVLKLFGITLLENSQEQCYWEAWEMVCPGRTCFFLNTRVPLVISVMRTYTGV